MPRIRETPTDFIIDINSYPFHRKELWNREKGIIRIYGKDGNMEKINQVIYPKKYYTYEYIESNILDKYEDCPLCKVGKEMSENKGISGLGIAAGIILGVTLIASLVNIWNKYKK